MPTQPEDRKPKTKKRPAFTFTGKDGETYTLPPATEARERLDGGAFEDAVIAGELGMLAYMVKCLQASGASDEARKALRALPQSAYLEVVNDWANFGDGDGASLGE